MSGIDRAKLLGLEAYAKARDGFRAQVLEHKRHRQVLLGARVMLQFEDELTMRYQVQEMLRIERIFEEEGIAQELAVYGPLVPDGSNFKATMMLEFPEVEQRREALRRLRGIEDRVWVQAAGCQRVFAIADEDLERQTAEKTSAVHFLRFELDPASRRALRAGSSLAMGVDHPEYQAVLELVPEATRRALVADLEATAAQG